MTHNRCGYARCAAVLDPDGPSPYWCDQDCMERWTIAQNRGKPLDPVAAEPMPASTPSAPPLLARVDDGTRPLPDLPAEAYPPDAVPLDQPALTMAEARVALAVSRRPAWVRRILGGRP